MLALGWPELSELLPDRGLPRGVVEIAAPHAHGGGTSIALAACLAAQGRGEKVHCAWLEAAEGPRLHAPEVRVAGVDMARLLLVRPPRASLAHVCVKVLASGVFDVVVVAPGPAPSAQLPKEKVLDERAVRRFALAVEGSSTTVLLLTDTHAPHVPWPVELRLEVERLPETISVRIARDKRGRTGTMKSVPLRTRPTVRGGPQGAGSSVRRASALSMMSPARRTRSA